MARAAAARPREGLDRVASRLAGFGLGLARARRLHARWLAGHLREVRRVRRLADALLLLALDPLEEDAEVVDGVVDARVDVSDRREAGRHRLHREVLGLDVGKLVPGDGRRDGRVGPPAHRVRRRHRAVARVLVVVDEDALAALLLPPRRRHLLRQPPLDLARERERGAPHDRELPVRLDPAEDVDAAVPRGLRPARVADLGEHLADERGDALSVLEGRSRLRVDVDAQLVGMLGVAPSRRPRVEVDDGEVRRPDHLRELGDAELVGVPPRREGHARRLHPLRPLLGHALLVDRLAGDAVREAAQLRRPLVQRADDALADCDVVLGEVALRLASPSGRAPCRGSSA